MVALCSRVDDIGYPAWICHRPFQHPAAQGQKTNPARGYSAGLVLERRGLNKAGNEDRATRH
jgi:hypothetical protein